ncbi:MAG: radical SAM protein [Kiritimatiellae bacterium]|nr:radical SAM protein [Kiritimatiellia bacterium]
MNSPLRVAIAYPPLPSEKGVPLLSQNRQFQWFNRPTYIYPVVPALAATMARRAGHDVFWLDGIASGWSPAEFDRRLDEAAPDLVALETKTPVVSRHWAFIRALKERCPRAAVALVGDHVTALPEESFANCPVDFVLTGGDHDFLLVNLLACCRRGEEGLELDPARLEPGVFWRDADGTVRNSGTFRLDHDLNAAPVIDRDLTQWRLYAEKNGNFRKTPGTYIMAGRDCWHGKCTFCSWTTLYPTYRVRDPIKVVDEIGELIDRYGVREIMDDTGSFPAGGWLKTFCGEMIARGYNKRVRIDCNMRFGCLDLAAYRLMRQAGFRLALFGLESANQTTLDRLVKGLTVRQIEDGAKAAAKAGLDVHLTVMFGYPWEGEEEILKTVDLARRLLRKGHAYTLQVTMVVPYPGTPLFREMDEAGLLTTREWDDYDMRRQVMRSGVPEEVTKDAVRRVYRAFLHPETLARRILSTRDPLADIKFYWRGFMSVVGHLKDFKG